MFALLCVGLHFSEHSMPRWLGHCRVGSEPGLDGLTGRSNAKWHAYYTNTT
jgi:hypothetical protein